MSIHQSCWVHSHTNHHGLASSPRSFTGSGHHLPCVRVEHRDNVDIAILEWARVLGCLPLPGPVAPSFLHLHFTLQGLFFSFVPSSIALSALCSFLHHHCCFFLLFFSLFTLFSLDFFSFSGGWCFVAMRTLLFGGGAHGTMA